MLHKISDQSGSMSRKFWGLYGFGAAGAGGTGGALFISRQPPIANRTKFQPQASSKS
jgi:hypothetical protein